MQTFLFFVGVTVGGVIVWFTKDFAIKSIKGASALAADLRVKAAKLEASIRAL